MCWHPRLTASTMEQLVKIVVFGGILAASTSLFVAHGRQAMEDDRRREEEAQREWERAVWAAYREAAAVKI